MTVDDADAICLEIATHYADIMVGEPPLYEGLGIKLLRNNEDRWYDAFFLSGRESWDDLKSGHWRTTFAVPDDTRCEWYEAIERRAREIEDRNAEDVRAAARQIIREELGV